MEAGKGRRRREGDELGRGGEGKGFAGPMSNYFLYAPVIDCMGTPITYSYAYLHMYLLERSYSTRTTMERTNFSRRFDKPDLNFQKVYTGHIQKS